MSEGERDPGEQQPLTDDPQQFAYTLTRLAAAWATRAMDSKGQQVLSPWKLAYAGLLFVASGTYAVAGAVDRLRTSLEGRR